MHATALLAAALIAVPFYGVLANPEAEAEPQQATMYQNWQQQAEKNGLGANGKGHSQMSLSGAIDGQANAQNPASFGGHMSLHTTVKLPGNAPSYPTRAPKGGSYGKGGWRNW